MKGPTGKFLHNPAGLIDQRDPKIQSANLNAVYVYFINW